METMTRITSNVTSYVKLLNSAWRVVNMPTELFFPFCNLCQIQLMQMVTENTSEVLSLYIYYPVACVSAMWRISETFFSQRIFLQCLHCCKDHRLFHNYTVLVQYVFGRRRRRNLPSDEIKSNDVVCDILSVCFEHQTDLIT